MRRSLPVAVALLLGLGALVACGDDEGDETAAEDEPTEEPAIPEPVPAESCEALETMGTIRPEEQPSEEELDLIRDARDVAPEDTTEAFDQLIELGELARDPDASAADFGALDDEALAEARVTLSRLAEACAVDLPVLSVLGGASDAAVEFETDALRTAIEGERPDVEVRTVGRFNDEIVVQVVDGDEASALAVCESAAAYLDAIAFDAEMRVTDTGDTALASRPIGGTCQTGDV